MGFLRMGIHPAAVRRSVSGAFRIHASRLMISVENVSLRAFSGANPWRRR